jgi:hypothetical protein
MLGKYQEASMSFKLTSFKWVSSHWVETRGLETKGLETSELELMDVDSELGIESLTVYSSDGLLKRWFT